MQLGKLNRYVRIEQKSSTNDSDYGSEVVTWTTYKNVWASILDITTRTQESTLSNLRLLKRPCKVITRYDAGIDSTMRLVVLDREDRILQIVTKPAELGSKDGLEFMCEDYSE